MHTPRTPICRLACPHCPERVWAPPGALHTLWAGSGSTSLYSADSTVPSALYMGFPAGALQPGALVGKGP